MLIIPAIDLRGGRCVRLVQGDFNRETRYDDDPVRVAENWRAVGAPWIHVVDLDGALAGEPQQLEVVAAICALGGPVELGGGLRTIDHLADAFAAGVQRVVLGTAAVERPELLSDAVARWGAERVILGVDARDGRVAVRGWEQLSELSATEVIDRARRAGIERVIYTDIERDGTLTSPNYRAIRAVAESGVTVIASGGVAERGHLERLATIPGVEAAIVGRALYDGALVIREAAEWWVDGDMGTAGRNDGLA